MTLAGYSSTLADFSFDSTDSSNNSGRTGSSTFGFDITSPAPTVTPEPGTLSLMGLGLIGMTVMFRRQLMV